MAIQMTQMMNAQPEKNISVNQSISAATLRRNVGRANAASVASAGRASNKDRSAELVVSVAPTATPANHSGSARCRLGARVRSHWWRQRHKVHNASGQAGQVNHSNRRPRLRHSVQLASGSSMRQRHKSSQVASSDQQQVHQCNAPAAQMAAASRTALFVAIQQLNQGAAAAQQHGHARSPRQGQTCQSEHASDGGRYGAVGQGGQRVKSKAVKHSCASAGVVSCDNWASPRQAMKASKPPSAMARA